MQGLVREAASNIDNRRRAQPSSPSGSHDRRHAQSCRPPEWRDRMYFMLHIGKTGGSYTQHIFSLIPAARNLVRFLDHRFTLETALGSFPGEEAVFAIRDPLAIFVSGFYSRMRQGRPRNNQPWSPEETAAFAAFQTPNQLAEALGSDQPKLRECAEFSMRSIYHVARCLHFYLGSVSLVRRHRSRICFILRQATLDEDIQRFLARNGILSAHLPIHDDLVRHANPPHLDRTLSPTAIGNLTAWYKTDLELYGECQALASEINEA